MIGSMNLLGFVSRETESSKSVIVTYRSLVVA
jgi:hypothetical protein